MSFQIEIHNMGIGCYGRKLSAWASGQPLVNRLWVFGSRARDNYRPDSDLDIAIELDMSAAYGADESGGFATWALESSEWQHQLEELTGLRVDLQYYHGISTPTIQSGLQQSSVLIYAKNV